MSLRGVSFFLLFICQNFKMAMRSKTDFNSWRKTIQKQYKCANYYLNNVFSIAYVSDSTASSIDTVLQL